MSKFLDLRKNGFFFYLFGNSLYVLICMFMPSVLKSFRCNFRNKRCKWVTNRKSMKLDFATLRIEEKTILQIKNLLTLFLFPDESLWLGVSMTHGSLDVGGELSSCVCAWGTWHWVWGCTAGLCCHPLLQVVWRLAGVIWFSDGGSPSCTPEWPQIRCIKAVFQGEEARLAPACSCCVQVEATTVLTGSLHSSRGKMRWTSFFFFFFSLLHFWDLSVRGSGLVQEKVLRSCKRELHAWSGFGCSFPQTSHSCQWCWASSALHISGAEETSVAANHRDSSSARTTETQSVWPLLSFGSC